MVFPRNKLFLVAAILMVIALGYNALFKWPRAKLVPAKQAQFIEAIEKRKWGRVHRLTAENYQDSLGLDRETLQLALKDTATMLRTRLDLGWEQTGVVRDQDTISISGNLRISGEGGPFANRIITYGRQFYDHPITFRWRKSGILPWNWQLENVFHPKARLPPDYSPGEIRERLRTGDF